MYGDSTASAGCSFRPVETCSWVRFAPRTAHRSIMKQQRLGREIDRAWSHTSARLVGTQQTTSMGVLNAIACCSKRARCSAISRRSSLCLSPKIRSKAVW